MKAAVVKASSQTSGFLWLFMTFCFSNPGIRCFSMCFHHFAVPTCTGTFCFPFNRSQGAKKCSFLPVGTQFFFWFYFCFVCFGAHQAKQRGIDTIFIFFFEKRNQSRVLCRSVTNIGPFGNNVVTEFCTLIILGYSRRSFS